MNFYQIENFEKTLTALCTKLDSYMISGNKPKVYDQLEEIKIYVVQNQEHLPKDLKTHCDSVIRYIINKIQKEGF